MVTPNINEPNEQAVLDVAAERVGTIYAKAMFGATEAAGQTDAVVAEFDSFLNDVLGKLPKFETILNSALVGGDEKIALLDKAIGKQASPLLMNFLRVVAQHNRLDVLRSVRQEMQELIDQKYKRVRVLVTSAVPLEVDQQIQLTTSVREQMSLEPVLELKVDPEIIGGIIVRIGDTVHDASIATQLNKVREQMIHRSVHEIQSRRDRFSTAEGN